MTEYRSIKGKTIQYLGTDPSDTGAEGQVWYNSAAGAFKSLVALEAWSAASPGITARGSLPGGGGTQTAAFIAGGYNGTTDVANTEEYNGSGFSNGGNLNTARYGLGGAGTLTAGLVFGGHENPPDNSVSTEEYDGSAWTAGGNLNTGRRNLAGFGIQTSAVALGGYIAPPTVANTEEYNGTSWTAGNVMNTARGSLTGCGVLTAGLGFGGFTGGPPYPRSDATESYDGTSWTTLNSLNTARSAHSGFGTQTQAVAAGGYTDPLTTSTETWDGTNWTNSSATLGTAKGNGASAGTSSAGVYMLGNAPSSTTLTEEYNKSINVITPGAWSAGGTIPYSAGSKNGSGILTAAFVVGGETPPGAMVNTSASYNGTSWTATNNINSARGNVQAAGTLTAGLIMGGYQNVPDPNFLFEETEEFNGTTWSEVNDMPTGGYQGGGTGTQTAAFVNNMYISTPQPRTNVTYEYDGTNWSSGGNTAETTNSRSSVGTLTAGLTVGGRPAPSSYLDKTELYDGTSWTSGVDMISEFQAGGQTSKGTQTDCMIFGSPRSPVNTDAFKTDGTTWFTQPSLGSYQNNGTGTSTAGLAFGVGSGSQEFTGETSAVNIKTLTTS